MIQQIETLLRRWGFIAPFDKDDVLNAETENVARHNEQVIGRLRTSLAKRFEINDKLRHSILIARRRTNSFAEFEQLISGRTGTDDEH